MMISSNKCDSIVLCAAQIHQILCTSYGSFTNFSFCQCFACVTINLRVEIRIKFSFQSLFKFFLEHTTYVSRISFNFYLPASLDLDSIRRVLPTEFLQHFCVCRAQLQFLRRTKFYYPHQNVSRTFSTQFYQSTAVPKQALLSKDLRAQVIYPPP